MRVFLCIFTYFQWFLILHNFGWMVNLAMIIFETLTKILIIWHPWHLWVCIHSDLKQFAAIPLSVKKFVFIWVLGIFFIMISDRWSRWLLLLYEKSSSKNTHNLCLCYVYNSWSYLHNIEILGKLTSVLNCPSFLHYVKVSLHRITQNPLSYLYDKKKTQNVNFSTKKV